MKDDSTGKIIFMDSEPIDSFLILEVVREEIDFPLTDDQWHIIDEAMEIFWNRHRPGSFVFCEENAEEIYAYCIEKRILISYDRILKITEIIWDCLDLMGFFNKS